MPCHHELRRMLSAEGAEPDSNNRRKSDLGHVGRRFVGGWVSGVGDERVATQRHVRSVRGLYSECLYRTVVSQLASPLRVSAEVVLRNIAAARAGGPPAPVAMIGQLSVCSLHQIRRMVPVPHYLPSHMGSVGNRSDTIMKRANVQLSRRVEFISHRIAV